MSSPRLFFALWPDPASARHLCDAVRTLQLQAGRPSTEADLHITLCFLGAVDAAVNPALCAQAAMIAAPPFELEMDTIEYWRRSRVLTAACSRTPAAASALARELRACAQRVGLNPDDRPLLPHVTLVRGLRGAPVVLPRLEPLPIVARAFYLAQSQELPAATASGTAPPRYQRLAGWSLQQAAH